MGNSLSGKSKSSNRHANLKLETTDINKRNIKLFIISETTNLIIKISPSSTIEDLKYKISDELGISANLFRIAIQNLKPLDRNELKLCDYDIQNGTHIYVTYLSSPQSTRMHNANRINIEFKGYMITHLSVHPTDIVMTAKRMIQNQLNIPMQQQTLKSLKFVFELEDNKTFKYYNIAYGETLELTIVCFHELLVNGSIFKADLRSVRSTLPLSCGNSLKYKLDIVAAFEIGKNYKENLLIYNHLSSIMKNKEEEILFHGSSFQNIDKIIYNGFNRDCNIRSLYGKGTYFSNNALIAAKYSKQDRLSGQYAMLVCKVLVGKYTLGHESMDDSSLYRSDKVTQYDSLVDNMTSPTIFVINRDYHAVPMYIVVFKKK